MRAADAPKMTACKDEDRKPRHTDTAAAAADPVIPTALLLLPLLPLLLLPLLLTLTQLYEWIRSIMVILLYRTVPYRTVLLYVLDITVQSMDCEWNYGLWMWNCGLYV